MKDHPFLQFVDLDENEPIFLTDLNPDLIAGRVFRTDLPSKFSQPVRETLVKGEQIADYLFVRVIDSDWLKIVTNISTLLTQFYGKVEK